MTVLARNLTELILHSGRTQSDIAKELGVGRATVSAYANGTRKPTPEMIKKICKVMDCTYEDLLGPIEQS